MRINARINVVVMEGNYRTETERDRERDGERERQRQREIDTER